MENSTCIIHLFGDLFDSFRIFKLTSKEGEETKDNKSTEMCIENDFLITNTKLRRNEIRKYTRAMQSRNETLLTEKIKVNQHNVKILQKAVQTLYSFQ